MPRSRSATGRISPSGRSSSPAARARARPGGFAVMGRAGGGGFPADKRVGWLWGGGGAMQRGLAADGIARIGQLGALDERDLAARYGRIGLRLGHLARGEDGRHVDPGGLTKSISAQTTFAQDEADAAALAHRLSPPCEKLAARLKAARLSAGTGSLQLKTPAFRLRTR